MVVVVVEVEARPPLEEDAGDASATPPPPLKLHLMPGGEVTGATARRCRGKEEDAAAPGGAEWRGRGGDGAGPGASRPAKSGSTRRRPRKQSGQVVGDGGRCRWDAPWAAQERTHWRWKA